MLSKYDWFGRSKEGVTMETSKDKNIKHLWNEFQSITFIVWCWYDTLMGRFRWHWNVYQGRETDAKVKMDLQREENQTLCLSDRRTQNFDS